MDIYIYIYIQASFYNIRRLAKAFNTCGGRQKLLICGGRQKLLVYVEAANSFEYMWRPQLNMLVDHIMIHQMVAAAEGGRHHLVRGG